MKKAGGRGGCAGGGVAEKTDQVMLEMYNQVKREICCRWGRIIANPPAHSE